MEYAGTDSHMTYTMDGKTVRSAFRSLFFDEIVIPETALARKQWRAENGKRYYYIGSTGELCRSVDGRFTVDSLRHKIGNYFKTKEEAIDSKFYKMYREEI